VEEIYKQQENITWAMDVINNREKYGIYYVDADFSNATDLITSNIKIKRVIEKILLKESVI
jgi:hypothetical protein